MEARRLVAETERLRAIAIHRAAFARPDALPLPLYQAARLGSTLRSRAEWWGGYEDGELVSLALRWPLVFRVDGALVEGSGFGSVCTDPARRGRGTALALVRALDRGPVGLLFSAVPPRVYERIGYAAAPGWDWVGADPQAIADSGPRAALLPIDPRAERDRLRAAWDAGHPGVHLARDAAAWERSLASSDDLFFAAADGYARLSVRADVVEWVEGFGVEPAPAVRAVAALAASAGRQLEGWFDPIPELGDLLVDRGRATTRAMVRGAEPSTARFWSSDYF